MSTEEHRLIAAAQQIIERGKREGVAIVAVPRWLLEALVEKASRPHD